MYFLASKIVVPVSPHKFIAFTAIILFSCIFATGWLLSPSSCIALQVIVLDPFPFLFLFVFSFSHIFLSFICPLGSTSMFLEFDSNFQWWWVCWNVLAQQFGRDNSFVVRGWGSMWDRHKACRHQTGKCYSTRCAWNAYDAISVVHRREFSGKIERDGDSRGMAGDVDRGWNGIILPKIWADVLHVQFVFVYNSCMSNTWAKPDLSRRFWNLVEIGSLRKCRQCCGSARLYCSWASMHWYSWMFACGRRWCLCHRATTPLCLLHALFRG